MEKCTNRKESEYLYEWCLHIARLSTCYIVHFSKLVFDILLVFGFVNNFILKWGCVLE